MKSCESQCKTLKNNNLKKKAYFFGSKTADQRFDEMQKKLFFTEICCKILVFFKVFSSKNAGWNIQHLFSKALNFFA